MTRSEIESFINSNSEEKIKSYFEGLNDKLQVLNSRNDRVSLMMLTLITIYFILDTNLINQLKFGPFVIVNTELTKLFVPLIFAYVFLLYATLNAHRSEMVKSIGVIGNYIFCLNDDLPTDRIHSNHFLQLIMPFSLTEELGAKYGGKKMGCLAGLIGLPVLPLAFVPFVFEIFAIKNLINNSWSSGWVEKVVIVLTIWIILVCCFYYVRIFQLAYSESNKSDKTT